MDKVNLERGSGLPLQIRSGHTPVNKWLLFGCLVASFPAIVTASTRSAAVTKVLPFWALYVFYGVLLVSSGVALVGVWKPLPRYLDVTTYPIILRRLVMERVGLYGVAGIFMTFGCASVAASGSNGLSGGSLLGGIAIGLTLRARQTVTDTNKLHRAIDNGGPTTSSETLADPDDDEPT